MTISLERNSIFRENAIVFRDNGIGISRERNNISRERNIIARGRNSISRERNSISRERNNICIHVYINIYFNTRLHDAPLLLVPQPKSELFQKSNSYNGPRLWNELPTHIRSIQDKSEFKTEIKKYYIRKFLSDHNSDTNNW